MCRPEKVSVKHLWPNFFLPLCIPSSTHSRYFQYIAFNILIQFYPESCSDMFTDVSQYEKIADALFTVSWYPKPSQSLLLLSTHMTGHNHSGQSQLLSKRSNQVQIKTFFKFASFPELVFQIIRRFFQSKSKHFSSSNHPHPVLMFCLI